MEISWLQSLILGLVSGFGEILPVSGQAHRLVLLKMFGVNSDPAVLRLLIHLGILAALYYSCRSHIVRMTRAKMLSRIPKRRRKRPLDMRSLMDYNLLRTTLIPIVIAYLFYTKTAALGSDLIFVAAFLAVNGMILYIPQYLPGSNKESGDMTPVEGLLMGLGGAVSTLPGISSLGTAVSIGTVRGMDQKYAMNTALIMNIPVTMGLIVYDLIDLFRSGLGGQSFGMVAVSLLAAAAAFAGVFLGIKALYKIADTVGFSVFGFYSWGAALLTFILYLAAV